MGKRYEQLDEDQIAFITEQKIFFVGTAAAEGSINISPKGMDTFRVIHSTKVVWLNLTGSGNETAAHLIKNNRMTIMFCAFEGKPLILRLYGKAKIHHQSDKNYDRYIPLFPALPGSRQIIELDINVIQTSCGYAVPFMDFKEERTQLKTWADKQGEAKIEAYWQHHNTQSIDGYKTDIDKNL